MRRTLCGFEDFLLTRAPIDLFLLDALANDLENLDDIVRLLNSEAVGWRDRHPAPFTREDIVPALARVIQEDLVEACILDASGKFLTDAGSRVLPDGRWDDLWFRLTSRGRIVHSNWEPDTCDPADSSGAA
jgi:hypothetical protein